MRTKSIRTNFQCLEGCRQTKLGNSDVRKWINGVGSWFYQQNKYIWSCWILSKWNTQVYDILEIYCWAVKKLLLSPSIDDTDSGIICSVSSPKVSVTFKLFLLLSLLLLLARFLGVENAAFHTAHCCSCSSDSVRNCESMKPGANFQFALLPRQKLSGRDVSVWLCVPFVFLFFFVFFVFSCKVMFLFIVSKCR